jgi:hypothetical protein
MCCCCFVRGVPASCFFVFVVFCPWGYGNVAFVVCCFCLRGIKKNGVFLNSGCVSAVAHAYRKTAATDDICGFTQALLLVLSMTIRQAYIVSTTMFHHTVTLTRTSVENWSIYVEVLSPMPFSQYEHASAAVCHRPVAGLGSNAKLNSGHHIS